MEWIAAALILGIAGSLHCVGMCGPLMLALPLSATTKWVWLRGRLLNQVGRIITYGLLGLAVGVVGQKLATAGLQQWLAIIAGMTMLFFIGWPVGLSKLNRGPFKLVGWLKSSLSTWLKRKGTFSLFILGLLNGLLPCGLVYIALASSLALGSAIKGSSFMMLFGLGTSPALLAVSGLGRVIRGRIHVKAFRAAQLTLVITALLFILRGANMGIPFVSPKVEVKKEQVDCCTKPYQ